MKTILGLCFARLLLGACLYGQTASPAATATQGQQQMAGESAQTSPQAQSAQPNVPRVAPGSVIPVQLTKTIDSKKAKAGEEIEVKVTQDMKNGSGEILVPKDTKVFGHVTEAQKRSKEQKESELGITFERAMMNGSEVPLPMSIQAIIVPPPQNTNPNAGADNSGPMTAPSGGEGPQTAPNAHGGGMGSSAPQETPGTSASGANWPSNTQAKSSANPNPRQPITGNTQGVIGDPNLTLSTATTASQPSVVSSQKDNVKLESGTMMLLRVTQ
jgi:hypothetical protein